jgi:hypothetical protein
VAGYWIILAVWALTALSGLYFGWHYGEGNITLLDVRSPSGFVASAIVLAWLAYPAWGYWLFKIRADSRRW